MARLRETFTLPEVVELAHLAMWDCFYHQINNLFDVDLDHGELERYIGWRDGFQAVPARPDG